MRDTPLVSVIMPTYNQAKWIRRAIDSVINQTYLNWELIVWDDGSTDNTEEIVRSYNNPRIKYYYDENRGVYHVRNQSIRISQGEYVALLDSDDEWKNEKLFMQVSAMIAHPQIDLIFANFLNINIATKETAPVFKQCESSMKLLVVEQVDESLLIIKGGLLIGLAANNFIGTTSVLVRRELFESIGLFYEEVRNSADFELWWRLGLANGCFAYINKELHVRYKYPENLSSTSIIALENRIKILDICLQEAIRKDRKDLIPFMNRPFRNAWQNLISLYGDIGDRRGVLKAFFQSKEYGLALGSIRLLIVGLFGQNLWTRNTSK